MGGGLSFDLSAYFKTFAAQFEKQEHYYECDYCPRCK